MTGKNRVQVRVRVIGVTIQRTINIQTDGVVATHIMGNQAP